MQDTPHGKVQHHARLAYLPPNSTRHGKKLVPPKHLATSQRGRTVATEHANKDVIVIDLKTFLGSSPCSTIRPPRGCSFHTPRASQTSTRSSEGSTSYRENERNAIHGSAARPLTTQLRLATDREDPRVMRKTHSTTANHIERTSCLPPIYGEKPQTKMPGTIRR